MALLGLAGDGSKEGKRKGFFQSQSSVPSRQKWARSSGTDRFSRETAFSITVSQTSEQARQEFEVVREALQLLSSDTEIVAMHQVENLTLPDIYGANSGPFDTSSIADTDDDEWLDSPVEKWTLEDILKADQVIHKLLRVYDWASSAPIQTWTPNLAKIGCGIHASNLGDISGDLGGSVEVTRVKTALDPSGRQSYQFRFSNQKFPVLRLLREREDELQKATVNARRQNLDKELAELQEEISNIEEMIRHDLVVKVSRRRHEIDRGLSTVARLDTIFAKAAFGADHACVVPKVKYNGTITVDGFCHPLLDSDDAVPIDLKLSGSGRDRALIISGVNGGGKTVAMKSFGVAAAFVKLGIPIPVTSKGEAGPRRVRVDFFDGIHASIGDCQSVSDGQSTFMGKLAEYSNLVSETVESDESHFNLLLLDEIGGGTDQNAGGAIAHSIMEKMLSNSGVRIVGTTHCPRLKTLSFKSPDFGCASVKMIASASESSQRQAYQLQYGIIGESSALSAASRCTPKLPNDVLERATFLLDTEHEEAKFLESLTESMQLELQMAESARVKAEKYRMDTVECQAALRRVALSYVRHFGLLEKRLDEYYKKIKDSRDSLELVGDILSEVRTVRRAVKDDADRLREQGLRLIPDSYELSAGESVTIIADGEWKGEMAKVCLSDELPKNEDIGPDDVVVSPLLMPWSDYVGGETSSTSMEFLVFKKSQLAIWDYQSPEEIDDFSTGPLTSTSDSTDKLCRVLATLDNPADNIRKDEMETRNKGTFSSAKERKASRNKKKKKKK